MMDRLHQRSFPRDAGKLTHWGQRARNSLTNQMAAEEACTKLHSTRQDTCSVSKVYRNYRQNICDGQCGFLRLYLIIERTD
jgi:hypothetical protein